MAGEDVSESQSSDERSNPEDSLEGWLDARAEELGVTREELLDRLQDEPSDAHGDDERDDAERDGSNAGGSTTDADDAETSENSSNDSWLDGAVGEQSSGVDRPVESDGGGAAVGASDVDAEDLAALRAEFDERVADVREEVEAELAAVRGDVDEKIDDVRDRVVQVKRETDGKAPADHGHPELRQQTEETASRADHLAADLDSLSATVEQVEETVGELDDTVEAGFENYEDVLEYLTDATDDLHEKVTTLAEVVVDLRDQTSQLAGRHATRAAADELAHLANRRGISEAECGHCGRTVRVALLAAPECPHCASTFNDVEAKQGFFGSHQLVVGDPPALEGERADWDVESVVDDSTGDDGVDTSDLEDMLGGDD